MKVTESIHYDSVNQVACWHCEEPVHRYATYCPYCQKALTAQNMAANANSDAIQEPQPYFVPASKIESHPAFERKKIVEEQEAEEVKEESFAIQVGHVLLALFALLSGSFFFFFGFLILLFSSNGTFSLEWKATSWPYFVLSALVLLVTGLWSLSKVEK